MAKKKASKHQEEMIVPAPVKVPPKEQQIVNIYRGQCPACGSFRYFLRRTDPQAEGRMEYRTCKSCHIDYKAFDARYKKK